MKNWKLTAYETLIERLVNLASLESSARFQSVYLDALRAVEEERTHLRRRCNVHCKPLTPISPDYHCYSRNA